MSLDTHGLGLSEGVSEFPVASLPPVLDGSLTSTLGHLEAIFDSRSGGVDRSVGLGPKSSSEEDSKNRQISSRSATTVPVRTFCFHLPRRVRDSHGVLVKSSHLLHLLENPPTSLCSDLLTLFHGAVEDRTHALVISGRSLVKGLASQVRSSVLDRAEIVRHFLVPETGGRSRRLRSTSGADKSI